MINLLAALCVLSATAGLWLLRFRLLSIVPHETIRIGGKPYLTRYYLTGRNNRVIGERGAIFLHHFHTSDLERELHNHPWPGASLILSGGYVEERCIQLSAPRPGWIDAGSPERVRIVEPTFGEYTPVTARVCRPGSIDRIGLCDFHRATLLDEERGCWTLFVAGRRVKDWGFLNRATRVFTPHYHHPEAIP